MGIQVTPSGLRIAPCVPKNWKGYRVRYRRGGTVYEIEIKNPNGVETGVRRITADGAEVKDGVVPYATATKVQITVEMG